MAATDKAGLEAALAAAEAALARGEAGPDLKSERGRLLALLGRADEARAAFLAVLADHPTHFAALNDFGALLNETGFRTAARTLFAEAVKQHPNEPLGRVNLAGVLMYEDQLDLARAHCEEALRLAPGHAGAHQRLSALLSELGDVEGAQRHRRAGFAARPAQTLPCLGDGEPIPLLVLTSTPAGDLAWPGIVDRRRFAITTLAAAFHDPAAPLPPHRLILNAIGDADLCAEDLVAAKALAADAQAPVLNPPDRVLATGRIANAARLGAIPGVRTPRMARLARPDISPARLADEGFAFPVLVRSPGFHNGRHFVRVEASRDLADAIAALPGPELVVMEPLGAAGPDGLSRKYRVMLIGGRLFPLHMAASPGWKVHYATSAMDGRAGLQAEEARFLEDMAGVLGSRAVAGLAAIQQALGLDYGGADFALGPDGEVLLFEANATMNIVPPGADAQWDYRRPAIDAALAAARAMIVARARPPGGAGKKKAPRKLRGAR